MKTEEFTQQWTWNIAASINRSLDRGAQLFLMESCGRACARREAVQSAHACQGDLSRLLSQLRRWVGKNNVTREGRLVHIAYEKCFCRLDDEVSARLGDAHCLCSVGWLKEMFETVLGKSVEADLLESIKRGAARCRFVVRLPD